MANPYVNIPLIIEGQQSSTQQLNTVIEATNKAGNQAVEALNYIITIPSQIVNAIHTKSGTIHTFAIAGFPLDDNNAIITKIGIRATITASIVVGDTFTLTDGTISYTGIVPLTPNGEPYELEISTTNPLIDFTVELGGSEKHAFFKGGASLQVGEITFKDKSSDAKFLQCTEQTLLARNYPELSSVITPTFSNLVDRNQAIGKCVAFGNNIYACAGGEAASPVLKTSPDTITWTSRVSPFTEGYGVGAFGFGNGLFFGVCSSNSSSYIRTSPDCVTWTRRQSAIVGQYPRAKAVNGMLFICGGLYSSTNGVTWINYTAPGIVYDIAYRGGKWLLACNYGRVYVTDNLSSITTYYNAGTSPIISIYADENIAVISSEYNNYYSRDNITWTQGNGGGNFRNIIKKYGVFYATKFNPCKIYRSIDGISFTEEANVISSANIYYPNSICTSDTTLLAVSTTGMGVGTGMTAKDGQIQLPNYSVPAYIKTV